MFDVLRSTPSTASTPPIHQIVFTQKVTCTAYVDVHARCARGVGHGVDGCDGVQACGREEERGDVCGDGVGGVDEGCARVDDHAGAVGGVWVGLALVVPGGGGWRLGCGYGWGLG
jgi:hypothetical protein